MKKSVLVLCCLLAACCGDDTDIKKEEGTVIITNPTPIPISVVNSIEYRVVGVGSTAQIIFGNTILGTSEVQSTLPWNYVFKTTKKDMFVYLSASSLNASTPIRIQIFVNNELFREAASTFGSYIEISGQLAIVTGQSNAFAK